MDGNATYHYYSNVNHLQIHPRFQARKTRAVNATRIDPRINMARPTPDTEFVKYMFCLNTYLAYFGNHY